MGVVEEDNGQYDTVVPVFWATGACLVHTPEGLSGCRRTGRTFFCPHGRDRPVLAASCPRADAGLCTPKHRLPCGGGHPEEGEPPIRLFLNFRNNLVMLYKNLPEEELGYVMRVRAVLDCVAALSFLLKGQFANMWAVLRARRAFHSLRPLFAADREENLKKHPFRLFPNGQKAVSWCSFIFYMGRSSFPACKNCSLFLKLLYH